MSSDIKSNGFLPSDLRIGIILFEKKKKKVKQFTFISEYYCRHKAI